MTDGLITVVIVDDHARFLEQAALCEGVPAVYASDLPRLFAAQRLWLEVVRRVAAGIGSGAFLPNPAGQHTASNNAGSRQRPQSLSPGRRTGQAGDPDRRHGASLRETGSAQWPTVR